MSTNEENTQEKDQNSKWKHMAEENTADKEAWKQYEVQHRRGRLIGGFAIVIIGGLFLIREMGVWLPEWLFTWQMLLIAIGLVGAIKHRFTTFGWLVPILVGVAFMLQEYWQDMNVTHYFWPIAIILIGLFMIFRPKKRICRDGSHWHRQRYGHRHHWKQHYKYAEDYRKANESFSKDDYVDFNSVFGGIKKNIVTKNFKGGEVNAVFGGCELNLMQADFEGTVELEINCVFGGASLILPSNWEIKSEIAAVMGSVEDKRAAHKDIVTDSNKVLILRGNAVFGGIEIQSY